MKDTATERAEHKAAREKRRSETFELLKLRLEENPEEIDEAIEYLGCSRSTIERWLDGGASLGGETAIRQEGFLRRKRILEPMELGDEPSIPEALYYGLADKLFSAYEVASTLNVSPSYRIIQYACDEMKATGWNRIHLEWYLHNVTVKQNGRSDRQLRPMTWLARLQPELAKLLLACCRGELTPEVIAEQLGVSVDRINAWLVWGHSKPLPPLMQRIHGLFAPFLTEDGNGRHEMPSADGAQTSKGGKSVPKSKAAPVAASAQEPESQPVVTPTTVTKSTAQVIQEQGELLRCLLLGFMSSRQPSKATAELEAIRVLNPDLWFELSLLVGVVADPCERYPAWRKSRR